MTLDPDLFMPVKSLNALRRDALELLEGLRISAPVRQERTAPPMPESAASDANLSFTVSLFHPEQLSSALLDLGPSVVYLPVERMEELPPLDRERYPDIEFCASLPRICKDSEEGSLLQLLELAKKKGFASLAIQNIGQLALAEKLGLTARGGYGLNVFNSRSLKELQTWGLQSACLSFELRHEQLRDLRKPLPCEAIVYGRLPLMITENCLISNAGKGCSVRRGISTPCSQFHMLTDRKGESFPVFPVFGCRSEVENSKILFLADKPEFRRCGLHYALLRFTAETPEECVRVMQRYLGQNEDTPADYTRGLFYRGVE